MLASEMLLEYQKKKTNCQTNAGHVKKHFYLPAENVVFLKRQNTFMWTQQTTTMYKNIYLELTSKAVLCKLSQSKFINAEHIYVKK